MGRGSRGTRYGREHEKARAAALRAYVPGHAICALCREVLRDPPRLLDLAHVPGSSSAYLGLAHRACNRDTSSERKPPDPEPKVWTGWD